MNDRPILLVAGLGRCGTTMMMTMLDAGGFPVTGPRPSYEPSERWCLGRPDPDWIAAQGGKAVKWIDPTNYRAGMRSLLPAEPVIILMERNPREQARSQVKLLADLVRPDRHIVKAMERSIRRDTPLVRAQMRSLGTVYLFRFEDVLKAPLMVANQLQGIIAHHFGGVFDSGVAARAVIPRQPSCAPDLWMENVVLPEIASELDARDAA